VVRTETPAVKESRQMVLRLLLAQAPDSPELVGIAKGLGVEDTPLKKPPRASASNAACAYGYAAN